MVHWQQWGATFKTWVGGLAVAGTLVLPLSVRGQVVTMSAKQLVAPPEDISNERLRLPDPARTGTWSEYGMITIAMDPAKDGLHLGQCEIPLAGSAQLVVLGMNLDAWQVNLIDSAGLRTNLKSNTAAVLGDAGPLGQALDALRVPVHDIAGPEVQLALSAPATRNGVDPKAVLLIDDEVPVGMYTWLSDHSLLVGATVRLEAQFYDAGQLNSQTVRSEDRQSLVLPIVDSWADVWHPDGRYERLSSDDVSGAFSLSLQQAGDLTVVANVRSMAPDGQSFLRTTTHLLHVEQPDEHLSGAASMTVAEDGSLQIAVGVDGSREKVLTADELWVTSGQGQASAVCWIGGMTPPTQSPEDKRSRVLGLDPSWLAGLSSDAMLTLRHVRLQDPDSLIPLDLVEELPLSVSDQVWDVVASSEPATASSKTRLMGKPGKVQFPVAGLPRSSRAVGGHNLILMHGYCSDGVSFEVGHYSGQLYVFWDPGVNRTHDEFALEIWTQGLGSKSYGLLGHSQGGTAALHLYAYYWSGVDWAQGDRLVQALGAPFEGTALAGAIAALGEIFGIQCGANFDMTYDGSALWLAGIPTWARQETYTSTSSFVDEWWSYDYCHIASDLLLSDPDDGVVESWSGHFDGGNNLGHFEGWCHIGGMTEPPEATDPSRNADFNESAAR